mgnify:FL=1
MKTKEGNQQPKMPDQETREQPANQNTDRQNSGNQKTGTILSTQSQKSEQDVNQVHWVIQKKGGVGKSLAASMIAQFLRSRGDRVEVVDTDPSNATLFGYKALQASRLDLMDGTLLNEAKFDALIMRILSEDANFVVDNGASSFIPLNNYLIENSVIDMIAEHGKQVVVHTVIAGGSSLMDSLHGFADLVEQMPGQARMVVWLNDHFGKIEVDGLPFEEMNVYLKNQDRIHGIVRLPKQNPATFGADMERMLTAKLTFDEINLSSDFDLMKKSRLFRVRKDIYRQLEEVV